MSCAYLRHCDPDGVLTRIVGDSEEDLPRGSLGVDIRLWTRSCEAVARHSHGDARFAQFGGEPIRRSTLVSNVSMSNGLRRKMV